MELSELRSWCVRIPTSDKTFSQVPTSQRIGNVIQKTTRTPSLVSFPNRNSYCIWGQTSIDPKSQSTGRTLASRSGGPGYKSRKSRPCERLQINSSWCPQFLLLKCKNSTTNLAKSASFCIPTSMVDQNTQQLTQYKTTTGTIATQNQE